MVQIGRMVGCGLLEIRMGSSREETRSVPHTAENFLRQRMNVMKIQRSILP